MGGVIIIEISIAEIILQKQYMVFDPFHTTLPR